MTLQELKRGIDESAPEDRLFLAAYLRHLAQKDDEAYRAELARRRDEMSAGKRFSIEQVRRVHENLRTEGL
jgi:hypothetical protein